MSYPLYPADPTADPAEPFRSLDSGPITRPVTTAQPRAGAWENADDARTLTTHELLERQREQFGGVKFGSALFGWITAAAIAVTITGLLAAGGAALRLGKLLNPVTSTGYGPFDAPTVGWIGVGTVLAIVLVAFYFGGYVAGRMARFSGVAQGLAVWAWAIVTVVIAVVLVMVLGVPYELLTDRLVMFSGLLITEDLLLTGGIAAVAAVAIVSLGGALLGGPAGLRFHRRVDSLGLIG